MTLLILAYLGGVLTILSPCVLPVVPFIFARAGRPFATSVLPLLIGMALTFAIVATLAAVGGGWVVRANEYGRIVAMVLLAVFGLMLLWPRLTDYVTQPLVAFGNRLSQASPEDDPRKAILASLLLGVAVGFLWAPCAGPILGLILTGAALRGANATTTLLLLIYAAGAATSLALALLVGGRVLMALKKSLGAGEWIRRGLGVAVLASVVAVALGLDTGLLTRLSLSSTAGLEQSLVDKVGARPGGSMAATRNSMAANSMQGNSMMAAAGHGGAQGRGALPDEGPFPPLAGAAAWLNSDPLTPAALRGKVVLVDFWTYSCINCLRTLPYVRAWASKYRDHGLVVIGVHTPEFSFEHDVDNVSQATKAMMINYPVAIDNDYAIWRAFENEYWPALYFVDSNSRIRHHKFGEGGYEESEVVIRQLLTESGAGAFSPGLASVAASGPEAAADWVNLKSAENYVGYERTENFASPGGLVSNKPHSYTTPDALKLNHWALAGDWTSQKNVLVLNTPEGHISYQFHARDLHLVMGPHAGSKPIRFRVLIDGQEPGPAHGTDVDEHGAGTLIEPRMYHLIRQSKPIVDRRFEISFMDSGAEAYSFTFG